MVWSILRASSYEPGWPGWAGFRDLDTSFDPSQKMSTYSHERWSALVSENSVFPTGISGTREKFFPHELLGSVITSDENKKFIFLTESSYFFFLFCDRENYEARTGAHIHLIQYNPGNCQPGSCEEALRTAPLLVQLMLLWTNQKCCRYLAGA